jgi:large subunit ribosomal protein L21e
MNKKKIRTKGKLPLNKYFQELKQGEFVAVTIEKSLPPSFPKRLQGRTGAVEGKRGRAYMISMNDQAQTKKFLIHPVHLKKIKA